MESTSLEFKSLELVSIGNILRNDREEWFKFYIPAYQRGYRWSSEQVEQLIDDLEEFQVKKNGNPKAFYCLQPLVVKPITLDDIKYFEVIDGQQRLTTVLLIMQALRQIQYDEERDEDSKPYFSKLPKLGFEIK